jgi:hypothetical protein
MLAYAYQPIKLASSSDYKGRIFLRLDQRVGPWCPMFCSHQATRDCRKRALTLPEGRGEERGKELLKRAVMMRFFVRNSGFGRVWSLHSYE